MMKCILTVLAAVVISLGLSACSGFAPVYGTNGAGGMSGASFQFAEPTNRTEQIIINRLKVAFPGPASAGDPVLKVSAGQGGQQNSMSKAFAVARPISTEVSGTVTVSQGETVLFTATRVTGTAYQSGKLTLNDFESRKGTQELAAQSTADALRAAILAGYRPGQMMPVR
jgi:hypothetical protein